MTNSFLFQTFKLTSLFVAVQRGVSYFSEGSHNFAVEAILRSSTHPFRLVISSYSQSPQTVLEHIYDWNTKSKNTFDQYEEPMSESFTVDSKKCIKNLFLFQVVRHTGTDSENHDIYIHRGITSALRGESRPFQRIKWPNATSETTDRYSAKFSDWSHTSIFQCDIQISYKLEWGQHSTVSEELKQRIGESLGEDVIANIVQLILMRVGREQNVWKLLMCDKTKLPEGLVVHANLDLTKVSFNKVGATIHKLNYYLGPSRRFADSEARTKVDANSHE